MGAPTMGYSPRFETLLDVLVNGVGQYASRPLFGAKRNGIWEWMTFAEFGHEVDRVRTGLADLGVGPRDVVGIIANNRPEWAIVAYATYGRGAAIVPMYEAQRPDDWRYILDDSGAKVVFVAGKGIRRRVAEFADELPRLDHVVSFEEGAGGEAWFGSLGGSGPVTPPSSVTASDIAGFVYTSGTTGLPKGVLLSHGNLAHNVSAVTDVYPLTPEDRTLSFLPWAHAFGQTVELHCIVAAGASTAFATSINQIVANLAEVRPTTLVSVPRIFSRIHDGVHQRMADAGGLSKRLFDHGLANAAALRRSEAAGRSSRLRRLQHRIIDRIVFSRIRGGFGGNLEYAVSGGAAIPLEVAHFIDTLGITVYEGYGLSETSPIVSTNRPGERIIGSVGKPIPGVRIELDHAEAADPATGEIVVHGHNVMQGYHNLPEENARVFTAEGGLRTGDLGRIDADGFLYVVGRVKEQYKLENGKYVVPTRIEEKIALSPYIANVMVHGANRPHNVALVVVDVAVILRWAHEGAIDLRRDQILDDERVRALIREEIEGWSTGIARWERVKDFALIDEDFTTDNEMLTPTMKIKRDLVMERHGDAVEALYGG